LGEFVHSFSYFHVDKSILGFSSEVLMVDNIVWGKVEGHSHVLIPIEWSFEVHILNVSSGESDIRGTDDTVPHDLQ
jgi:hypothetical protein